MMLLNGAPATSSSASHFGELCQGIIVDEQTNREGMAFPSQPKHFNAETGQRQGSGRPQWSRSNERPRWNWWEGGT